MHRIRKLEAAHYSDVQEASGFLGGTDGFEVFAWEENDEGAR
jgi:hypothetical protein